MQKPNVVFLCKNLLRPICYLVWKWYPPSEYEADGDSGGKDEQRRIDGRGRQPRYVHSFNFSSLSRLIFFLYYLIVIVIFLTLFILYNNKTFVYIYIYIYVANNRPNGCTDCTVPTGLRLFVDTNWCSGVGGGLIG